MTPQVAVRQDLDVAAARAATDRLRLTLTDAHEQLIGLWQQRAHEALDYGSGLPGWTAYLAAEFGELLHVLPTVDQLGAMVDAGMTQREAAAPFGVSLGKVNGLLRQRTAASAPAVEPVVDVRPVHVQLAAVVAAAGAKGLTIPQVMRRPAGPTGRCRAGCPARSGAGWCSARPGWRSAAGTGRTRRPTERHCAPLHPTKSTRGPSPSGDGPLAASPRSRLDPERHPDESADEQEAGPQLPPPGGEAGGGGGGGKTSQSVHGWSLRWPVSSPHSIARPFSTRRIPGTLRVSCRTAVAGSLAVGIGAGLIAALRPGIGAAELTAAAALFDPLAGPVALGSPWAPDNHLARIVVDDILGVRPPGPPSRAEAIRVPAVARARGVVCTTIARIDLGAYRGDTRLDTAAEPSWLHATDGPLSPFHRMLWTLDDLLFYGWAAWEVTQRETVNGVPDAGFPQRMRRLAPLSEWRFEPDTGRVLRATPEGGWRPTNARELVLIPGPHEGLLVEGAPAVSHARDLQRSAHNAARFPSAYLGLKQTSGAPLKRRSEDPDEVTVETILQTGATPG
jgi:hypothetical protein